MTHADLAAVAPHAGEGAREYSDRLFDLVQRAVIVEPIGVVQRAYASLPAHAAAWRSGERRTLARLHAQIAVDSAASGWLREARAHARRAVALEPARLLRRQMWTCLRNREHELAAGRNLALAGEAVRLVRHFQSAGIETRLVGTLAISLHAGEFVKLHDDIDFVMPRAADLEAAVSLLTGEMGYVVTLSYDWMPPGGSDTASLRKLEHPAGTKLDIAHLPHWPVRPGTPARRDGVELPVVDLRDLRNTYAVFLVMNEHETTSAKRQSDRHTILTLDRLLHRPPTVAVIASECDRLPAGFPESPFDPAAVRPAT